MSTNTALDTDILNDVDLDDPIKAHIVYFSLPYKSGDEWVAAARENRLEVEALCGHTFIPERDPLKHPICESCLQVAQALSGSNQ